MQLRLANLQFGSLVRYHYMMSLVPLLVRYVLVLGGFSRFHFYHESHELLMRFNVFEMFVFARIDALLCFWTKITRKNNKQNPTSLTVFKFGKMNFSLKSQLVASGAQMRKQIRYKPEMNCT